MHENCPILTPTLDEFSNFAQYIEYLDKQYKPHYGMVKIRPPPQWFPTSQDYSTRLQKLIIKGPIEQQVSGKQGVYQFKHKSQDSISYQEYVSQNMNKETILKQKSSAQIEDLFWKTLPYSPAIYGADLVGTLMDQSAGKWNLNNLETILNKALSTSLRGVTNSYCYIGSWKTCFCWHKEDLDLSAINFLHLGRSKFWYCIQWEHGPLFEKQAKRLFQPHFSKCPEHLRHKTLLIKPTLLKRKIPQLKISKIQQKPGQFIIAFGGSYHCGFNFGINIAQAVNYASFDWLKQLPHSRFCTCRKSSVRASHEEIVKNLQNYQEIASNPAFMYLKKLTQQDKSPELGEQQLQKIVIKKSKQIAKRAKNKQKKERKPQIKISNKIFNIQDEVQCDRCELWRIIPEDKKVDDFGQRFECSELGRECGKQTSQEMALSITLNIN